MPNITLNMVFITALILVFLGILLLIICFGEAYLLMMFISLKRVVVRTHPGVRLNTAKFIDFVFWPRMNGLVHPKHRMDLVHHLLEARKLNKLNDEFINNKISKIKYFDQYYSWFLRFLACFMAVLVTGTIFFLAWILVKRGMI